MTPSQPKPRRRATSWTSLASPQSTKRAVLPRWPVRRRCWWTAPTARSEGMGILSGPASASERTRMEAPLEASLEKTVERASPKDEPTTAAEACSQSSRSAVSSAEGPVEAPAASSASCVERAEVSGVTAKVASSVAALHSRPSAVLWPAEERSLSRSWSVSTGWSTTRRAQLSAVGSRMFASGPTGQTSDMTSSSRIGSIGGLVTWAKSCLK
mmetsp:Transcript_22323/g.69919  ORF Transcript_22323/g.69919 Transcript_22323/m.69919 type:complete len:213 (+) Transcript_22323:1428-2066(+)